MGKVSKKDLAVPANFWSQCYSVLISAFMVRRENLHWSALLKIREKPLSLFFGCLPNLFSNVFGPLEISRSYIHCPWVGFVYCGIKDCFITMPVLEQGSQCSQWALLVAGLYELHGFDGWEDLLYSKLLYEIKSIDWEVFSKSILHTRVYFAL